LITEYFMCVAVNLIFPPFLVLVSHRRILVIANFVFLVFRTLTMIFYILQLCVFPLNLLSQVKLEKYCNILFSMNTLFPIKFILHFTKYIYLPQAPTPRHKTRNYPSVLRNFPSPSPLHPLQTITRIRF